MLKKYINPLFIYFLILSSCTFEDDLLRNTREDYLNDSIRIDGFYYAYSEGQIRKIYFLYRNGVYFSVVGDGQERTKPEEVKTLLTEERFNRLKTEKTLWGIFIIKGNDILFESWSKTHGDHYSVVETGEILNDTTFTITKRDDNLSGISSSNYTYYFYPYSPKPDSTNVFIE